MSDCAFQSQLAVYHDGELDAERRGQVEAHLASCDACRRELRELRELSRTLTLAAAATADDSTATATDLAAMHETVDRLVVPENRTVIRLAGFLSLMAASVAIISGVWLYTLSSGAPSTALPAAVGSIAGSASVNDWEHVAMNLRVVPPQEQAPNDTAVATDWMVNNLMPRE